MHGDRERLPLDPRARDGAQACSEVAFGSVEGGEELRAPLVGGPVGQDDVEPVAPGVRDPLDPDQPPHVRQVPAAHDRHRCERGQPLDRGAGLRRQQRVLGTLDDRGERPVVVEEDGHAPTREQRSDLVRAFERRREVSNVRREGREPELGEIGNHHVGAGGPQGVRVAGAIDPDHEPEPTPRAGLHARERVLDHRRRRGVDPETPSGLDEHRRIRLAGQAELIEVGAVDRDREEVPESGRVQDLGHVPARGDRRRPYAACLQLADQGHGRRVRLHAVPAEVLEEHLVLPIPQPADGLPIRRIVRVALGQLDASRGEEAPHAVEPTLAVDVPAVVLVGIERHERFAGAIGALAQVVVEQPLPGLGVDGRGVGDDAVHVEDHGADLLGKDGLGRGRRHFGDQSGARFGRASPLGVPNDPKDRVHDSIPLSSCSGSTAGSNGCQVGRAS